MSMLKHTTRQNWHTALPTESQMIKTYEDFAKFLKDYETTVLAPDGKAPRLRRDID